MLYVALFVVHTFCILQGIAFLTLYERHVLGLTQNRMGPGKRGLWGFVQPTLDGVKLLKKENIIPLKRSFWIYVMLPVTGYILMMVEFLLPAITFLFIKFTFSLIMLLIVVRAGVYPFIRCGVFIKSKLGYIGALRAARQTIALEVVYSLLMLIFYSLNCSYTLQRNFSLINFVTLAVFFIRVLVELRRAPFDFAEGERELVRGYNVEYSGVNFTLLFLKEYGSLIYFRIVLSLSYFNGRVLAVFGTITAILLVRSSLPRVRYDVAMYVFWTKFLPLVTELLRYITSRRIL